VKGPKSSSLPGVSDESLLSFSIWLDNNKSLDIVPEEHYRVALDGIAGSPGITFGPAYLHTQSDVWVEAHTIPDDEVDDEIERLKTAVSDVIEQRRAIQRRTEETIGRSESKIFESHAMLLEDPELLESTASRIRSEHKNAEYCFYVVLQETIDIIGHPENDDYLRERTSDIEDVRSAVLMHMSKRVGDEAVSELTHEAVIVAHGLTPSDTVRMPPDKVIGFVTETGGPTNHASILARSMDIPAIVGCANASSIVVPGDTLILDGYSGRIYVGPDEILLEQVRRWQVRLNERTAILNQLSLAPAQTADGHHTDLELNIELPEEIDRAAACPANGVGLYRTEFLFLARDDWPSEEEQYVIYTRLAKAFVDRPVTIRTMDVGGDKLSKRLNVTPGNNPFLGWRAIRISLAQPDIFRTQLCAILRASAHGNVRLMFPMVTSVDELRKARVHVDEARDELDRRGQSYDPDMLVGTMIETPASVMIADFLAIESDFFSIGTNDLTQYTLAVDRDNEHVASLFDTSHPAVIRLIHETVEAGHRAGIEVYVCGEMAHEPVATMLLIGLGVDGLSMAPGGIPETKQLIRQFSLEDAQQVALEAMKKATGEEVRELVRQSISQRGILAL
jgi:phosphoenolpyruvate-protein phosphotransferase (PTS system enzyme I)